MGASAASSPQQNSTIPVPEGTTNHGDPNILCTRSTWSNVAAFFLANYVAHAATVKSNPGQPVLRGVLSMLLALILPTSGVLVGLDAIRRCAVIGGSPLQKAKKAGALCEVVRTHDWKPQPGPGDVVQRIQFKHTRDEHNLAKIKMMLESRRRWVASKLSWLTKRNVQLDSVLPSVIKMGTLVEHQAMKQLDRKVQGVKNLLQGESRLVRWSFYVAIIFNARMTRKSEISELLNLPQRAQHLDATEKQTTQPRVTLSPKICIAGLGESFKPSCKILDLDGRNIHGLCCLPPGYGLSIVHSQSTVLELNDYKIPGQQTSPADTPTSIESYSSMESGISWSYNFSKGLIAIFQALYASATLYEARGDQIERYGYAAFGLTVAPYLMMSIINLVGTVLTPDYSTLFMVESEIMKQARERDGAFFGGAVGKLAFKRPTSQSFDANFRIDDQDRTVMEVRDGFENSEETPQMSMDQEDSTDDSRTIIMPACHDASEEASRVRDLFGFVNTGDSFIDPISISLAIVVGLVSVAINGGLSHFKAGKSTHAQRVWTMTWLAVGIYYGLSEPIFDFVNSFVARYRIFEARFQISVLGRLGLFLVACAPAIGGFVVVGQMLMSYGHCIQIGDDSS